MRSLPFLSVVCAFFLLATFSSAWPWRPYGLKLAHGEILERRQDDTTTTAEATDNTATTGAAKTAAETASETGTATGTKATDSSKTTGTNTAKETDSSKTTGTATGKASKTDDESASTTSIDPRLPAGGVSMLTPSAGAITYYKIGDYVTFAWNYTSLSVTPTAVNVVATCKLNQQTYTISSNMSVEATGRVVWDTGKYQSTATVPLLTASYTLVIWDASKSMSDMASAGHLGAASNYFAMYSPQPYTSLDEYHCATCNGAFSDMERHAMKFMAGMATITVLTFTWFAGGSGVLFT